VSRDRSSLSMSSPLCSSAVWWWWWWQWWCLLLVGQHEHTPPPRADYTRAHKHHL